jgi:DinB superfamily
MLSAQDFIRLFTIENNLIQSQTEGLTQADTLIQPQPTGNCMNWVLGHILENQVTMLTVLGGISPVDPAGLGIYKRESEPITTDQTGVLRLEYLLEQMNAVHAALVACLAEMNDADFSREIQQGERKFTLGWRFLFLHFHYTYHIGQLELLRQLAGQSDKIV